MTLLRVLPPQNFIFCGADFGSTIALDQGYQTRFSSRVTSGIFNLKRTGPVKSLHNILL